VLVVAFAAVVLSCALARSAWATDTALVDGSATLDETSLSATDTSDAAVVTESGTTDEAAVTPEPGSGDSSLVDETTSPVPGEGEEVPSDAIPTPPATDVAPPASVEPAPAPETVIVDQLPPITEPPAALPIDPIASPDPKPLSAPALTLGQPAPLPDLLAASIRVPERSWDQPQVLDRPAHEVRSNAEGLGPGTPFQAPTRTRSAAGSGGSVSPTFSPDNSGTGFALLALALLCLAYGGTVVRSTWTVPLPVRLIFRLERPG
jgi:hypothetical protein